ncbi:MAG TPA: dihydrolipoamide acetyltransferase family protein [Gemmatimonadales bacterium]
MAEFRMPALGADMTAGRLVTWYKQPGETVQRGDIIAEVDTDKGAIDVEVFVSGVVERILVQPGEKVPVGTPLAVIRETGEAPAPAPPPAPPPAEDERRARMRQAIAAAVTRSKREIPHFYLSVTIDLHRALAWLGERNADRPVADRLLPGALFVKAVALALREVPELNGRWEGERAVRSETIHVGIATFLRDGGLVAPALHNTDRQSLDEVMRDLRDLVNRARAGELRSSELSDPTITVTSLGERGVDAVFGVIYPPQVAIVGFGTVAERPWVVNGQVVPRPLVTATLAADHRVTDGHRGGLFLASVDALLQEPTRL